MIDGYQTVNDVAKAWQLTTRRVRALCAEGQIDGATKIGREWVIPENAVRPKDGRITSGLYIKAKSKKEGL